MQRLTFIGYLESYIQSLSSINSKSINRLAKEANANFRLREPLFLYALFCGKVELLLRSTNDEGLYSQYHDLTNRYTCKNMLEALETGDESLDRNYHKVYNSYACRRNMPETHSRSKALMHAKIKRLQNEKNVSNYRIYTDLKLNPGNINSYLKTGDVTKVSRDVARRIVQYLGEQF